MQGFFSKKETQSTELSNRHLSCSACGKYTQTKHARIKAYGNGKKSILNILPYPEDTPYEGKEFRLLTRYYKKYGIDVFEDCYTIYAVQCSSMKIPSANEIACCRLRVIKVVNEYQPKVIFAFGEIALNSLIADRYSKAIGSIHQWRGFQIPDQDLKAYVCPVLQLLYVDKFETKEAETVFKQDFEQALKKLDETFYRDKKPTINVIDDISDLKSKLSNLIAFDYETTGLKPHAQGHRIISNAVCDNADSCYVFLMPRTRKEWKPWTDILADKHIFKMAHNIKFEEAWSVNILRQNVLGWEFDSMIGAHIIDNRRGITSLDFQVYVNFGIADYSSDVKEYLRAKTPNEFNRINELLETHTGKNMLLTYNAYDAVYEYRLAMKQINQMNYSFLPF